MESPRSESTKNTASAKQLLWEQHLSAWQSSGQTQLEYCNTHALKHHQFLYWRRKFRSTAAPGKKSTTGFVQVEVLESASTGSLHPGIVLEADGGYRVHIASDFNADTLRRLLAVLAADRC